MKTALRYRDLSATFYLRAAIVLLPRFAIDKRTEQRYLKSRLPKQIAATKVKEKADFTGYYLRIDWLFFVLDLGPVFWITELVKAAKPGVKRELQKTS